MPPSVRINATTANGTVIEYASISEAAQMMSDKNISFNTRKEMLHKVLDKDTILDSKTWARAVPVVAAAAAPIPAPLEEEWLYKFPADTHELFRNKSIRWIGNPVRFRATDVIEVVTGTGNASNSMRCLGSNHPEFFAAHTETFQFAGCGNQPAIVLSVDATLEFIGLLHNGSTTKTFRSTTLPQFEIAIRGEMVKQTPFAPMVKTTTTYVIRTRVDEPHDAVTFATINAAANSVLDVSGFSLVHTRRMVTNALAAGGEEFAGFKWNYALPQAEEANQVDAAMEADERANPLVAKHNGQIIATLRPIDGFIHATQMCKAGNKTWPEYAGSKFTKNFIAALNLEHVVISIQAGRNHGSWVHPKLAIHLAEWLNPAFVEPVKRLINRNAVEVTVAAEVVAVEVEVAAVEVAATEAKVVASEEVVEPDEDVVGAEVVAHNIVDVLNGYMIGDKKVRKTLDVPPKISVIDLIVVVTEQSADAASMVFRRMASVYNMQFEMYKFPGRGQRLTPNCLHFKNDGARNVNHQPRKTATNNATNYNAEVWHCVYINSVQAFN